MHVHEKVKPSKEELMAKVEVSQRDNEHLYAENNSVKETVANLKSTISTELEERGRLQASVITLTTDAEKASAKIQELETGREALDNALEERTQSLSEVQSQYNTEKKRLEDDLCAFRKANEMLTEKLQKEEGDRATLCLRIASLESTNLSLNSTLSTKLEEIGELQARVRTLTTDAEKSSATLQELERARDTLEKALKESTLSLSVKAKELSEVQSQYNTEKKRLEDELYPFRKEKEDKLKEEEEIKRRKIEEDNRRREEEIKRKEEEEKVRSSVQPRSNTPGGGASSLVFTPITCTESICKHSVKAGWCLYRANALDINKYNVLAVTYNYRSVYLYSETNKTEEKLCACQYPVNCLAWNQQGTLLAIGGEYDDDTNKNIEVWDIPNRKITKRLKIMDNSQYCWCLDWKGDTVTAGTFDHIYQWNINDQDNEQDTQGNKALLPTKTVQTIDSGWIRTVQWSNCKSKLATIASFGDVCIYDEELKLIYHDKAHNDGSFPILQWCPWDNQVIATAGWNDSYLKIWRVQQGIPLIKEVKHESAITNIKWIPSKKAIITGHWNNQLVLWEYPSLSIIRTIKGHTCMPEYLALNADKSAMVSQSDKEMIFWKPFDQI